jgi:UDP-N-acetylglucosamine 3-dehydrogenase
MKELRVAIVGSGRMGKTHAAKYVKVRGARPVVAVDIVPERAKTLKDAYQMDDWYEDYRAAVNRPDIDMVDVCTPTWVHEEVAVAAAEAGKHVLCEKPMSLTVPAAKRMQEAADRAGVLLMIALCRRFDNGWMKVRELVQAGVLGRPVVWRSVVAIRGGAQPWSWFVQKDQGGGPIVDGAIHNLDFARYMFGEAQQVAASTMTFREDATAADTGSALVRFVSGDDLVLSWSWGLPLGARGASANDIIGPKGALYFSRDARSDFATLPALDDGWGAIVVDGGEAGIEQYPYRQNDMYCDEIQAFVDAVREGRVSPVDSEAGVGSLAMAEAILQAGESGQTIIRP